MEEEKPTIDPKVIHELNSGLYRLAVHMERASFHEYTGMFRSPVKFMLFNFLAGVSRGLGVAVGMTIVAALLLYVLAKMIDLPIIGYYVAQIVEIVNKYLAEGKNLIH